MLRLKKIALIVSLVAAMTISVTACGDKKDNANNDSSKEKLTITVTDEEENLVSEIDIERTTERNGAKKDKVKYQEEKAKATI